jgi:hypothetical protein
MFDFLTASKRDKITSYIGTAIPVLIIIFCIASQFVGEVKTSLDGMVSNTVGTALFVMMILLMYGSVYGNHSTMIKESNEKYADAVKQYEDERKIAVMHDYSEFDNWVTKTVNDSVERMRERIVSACMSFAEYCEKHKAKTVRQLKRDKTLPPNVRKSLIAAKRVKPIRVSRLDLLSYSPDGNSKTVYTYSDAKKREAILTIRTLLPKIIFAVFSVNIVFSVVAKGAPEILSVLLQTTSLLTTAHSALRNATTKVMVYEIGHIVAKTEMLKKFNSKEKAAP